MRPRPLVAAVLLVAAFAAGCGPDDEDAPTVTTTPSTVAVPTPSTEPPGTPPGRDDAAAPTDARFSTTTASVPPTPYAYLTAVRAARHAGFDRVVFEFESSAPGYRVAYVNGPVVEAGSGEPVKVEGDALLEVHMEAAAGAELVGERVRQTYTGPRRIDPDTTIVTEVVRAGDFEANLEWVVGLSRRAPFRVFTLTGPARLVVDVAHEA